MIISVAEAAEWTGGDANDAQFQRLVGAVDAHVKRFCGRLFELQQRTIYPRGWGYNAFIAGTRESYVLLDEMPVASIDEVRIDASGAFPASTIVDTSSFVVTRNKLTYRSGYIPEGEHVIQVQFTAGYDAPGGTAPTMPEDLRDVCFELVAMKKSRGASEEFQSESIGDYSYTRFEAGLPPLIRATLKDYRLPR